MNGVSVAYMKRLISTGRIQQPHQNTTRLLKLRNALLCASGITAGCYVIDSRFNEFTGYRTIKAICVLSMIGLDYKYNFKEGKNITDLHERNATRLLTLLTDNKGLYIKVGQNIANQAQIFPKPFQQKFAKLYDSAPTDPWENIDDTLKSELGTNYTEQFQKIDKKPVASASIAQIHKATLKNGDEVALKIQHHYIAKQIDADLMVYKLFTKLYAYFFEIPISFTTSYVARHLQQEVDFLNEMKNGRKIDSFISQDSYLKDKVHIPKTYDMSTKRVLVAEWCAGESLVDFDHLKTKYNTKSIMKNYLTTFSKMIFQWGFVHSDPHPGNLLVRFNEKNGKQELVLLDHGLYVKISPKVRSEYCSLWKSLFEFNDKELKKIAIGWGIGEKQSDMFASFQLLKPYHKTSEKMANLSGFERDEFLKESFKQFFEKTEKFPLELIFLGRTMRMLQLLNQKYKAPVNRINLFTKEAVKGYYLNGSTFECTQATTKRFWCTLEKTFRYTVFMVTMGLSDLIFFFTSFGNRVFGTRNMEDVLQMQISKELKELGVDSQDNIDLFSG